MALNVGIINQAVEYVKPVSVRKIRRGIRRATFSATTAGVNTTITTLMNNALLGLNNIRNTGTAPSASDEKAALVTVLTMYRAHLRSENFSSEEDSKISTVTSNIQELSS